MRKEGPYFAIQERPRLVRAAVTDADFRFLSGGDEPRGWPPYRPSRGRFFLQFGWQRGVIRPKSVRAFLRVLGWVAFFILIKNTRRYKND